MNGGIRQYTVLPFSNWSRASAHACERVRHVESEIHVAVNVSAFATNKKMNHDRQSRDIEVHLSNWREYGNTTQLIINYYAAEVRLLE